MKLNMSSSSSTRSHRGP